jgi:acetylornithine deacetylase
MEGSHVFDESMVESLLARLVRSPSTQTGRFEADPGIQSYLRETVADAATELGLEPAFDPMGNLVVRAGRGGRRVLIFAYAMTHPANRMRDPFSPTVQVGPDGRPWMRGRGVAEQKAAVAAALMAAAALRAREQELEGELVLCVSTAGETGRHDAARSFLSAFGEPPIDWAVVALGTGNQIGLGNKGRLDVLLTVRGRASHSSTPWAGLDAIVGARRALDRLDGVRLSGSHPQLGSPTLTATSIRSSPDATHTVQDEVRITLDRRLLPGDDPERALAELRAAVEGLGDWGIDLEAGPFMYPSQVAAEAPVVQLLEEAAAELGAQPPGHVWSHGAIDAGYFNHEGIPAVMLGPGAPEMFHTDDESVALADVAFAARLYAAAAGKYLTATRREGAME